MKAYDRETCLVCSTSEYAVLHQNAQLPAYLTLGLVDLIAEKTGLPVEKVVAILFNELTPEKE